MIEAPVISLMENVLVIRIFMEISVRIKNALTIAVKEELALKQKANVNVKMDGKDLIVL